LICIFSLRFFMVFLSPSTKILVFCIRMGHDHILPAEQVASIDSTWWVPDCGYSWCPLVPPGKCWDSTLNWAMVTSVHFLSNSLFSAFWSLDTVQSEFLALLTKPTSSLTVSCLHLPRYVVWTIRCHSPQDHNLNFHCCENCISHLFTHLHLRG
jgi:hypothetical protein